MTHSTPIQVGLSSYGMSGTVFHGPLLKVHPGFHIRRIVERTAQQSKAAYPEAEITRSFGDLLRDEAIQLVIVNTPDYLHYEMTEQALRAGKHVIVEKPFTFTYREAENLIELANQQKKLLSVFQNRRWDGDFLTVQQVVRNGWLGELVEYEAHYDRFRNYVVANTWKEGTQANAPGLGILYNLGSHMIDQALVLFGKPQRVTADIRIQRTGGQVPDAYDLLLEYGRLKVTLKAGYLVREPGPRYTLHGTEGSFVKFGIDPQEEALKAGLTPGGPDWGKESESDWGLLNTQLKNLHFRGKIETLPGNYLQFYDGIYTSLVNGVEPTVKAEEAALVIRVIEAAIESNQQKRTVEVE